MIRVQLFFQRNNQPRNFREQFKAEVGETITDLCDPQEKEDTIIMNIPEEARTRIMDTLKAKFWVALQKPLNSTR